MKTIEGSSRGRGGYRGRGRGGGGRGRGSGDQRFAARFTDPRFQLTQRVKERQSQSRVNLPDATRDERFAKHFARRGPQYEEEEEEAEEDEESLDSRVVDDYDSNEDAESEDNEVEAWKPDDVSFTDPKKRLAVVNCDWDHVRAVDLFAILFHALPLGGQLKEVSVYMSEFGKQMIERERALGPDLWVKPGEEGTDESESGGAGAQRHAAAAPPPVELVASDVDDDLDGSGEEEEGSDGWQDDDVAMLEEEGEDGERFSSGKYRKYEMDRMRYYYAIATFDSAETAAAVYEALDGMDVEATGVLLDLRYVEDGEVFENPVSTATSIPPNFKPLGHFKASALTQTRFRISWDQDDAFRHNSLQDAFTGTTTEDDLAAYMAPSDSDDDGDGDGGLDAQRKEKQRKKIRQRYAALLQEIGGLPDVPDGEAGDSEDEDGEEDEDDDDSLNRFSDVDMTSNDDDSNGDDEEADTEAEDDGDGEVMGDVEATIDLGAGDKATQLQTQMRRQQKAKNADLASKAEIKYKLRRKEMKKSKKQMALEERESERQALEAEKDARKQHLKELLDTDDDGAVRIGGKKKRKQHAKVMKQRAAEERLAKKKEHIADQLGIARELRGKQEEGRAEAALATLDDRFQSKLISDPRFHLEVAQKDKRIASDVTELASTVALARRAKKRPASQASTEDDAVDYFLQNPSKRAKR